MTYPKFPSERDAAIDSCDRCVGRFAYNAMGLVGNIRLDPSSWGQDLATLDRMKTQARVDIAVAAKDWGILKGDENLFLEAVDSIRQVAYDQMMWAVESAKLSRHAGIAAECESCDE